MEVIKFLFYSQLTKKILGSLQTLCENRPICTRFRWKLLSNPSRWELTRVRFSTRHVLIHIFEALNQHNSSKTIANPVVPVCAPIYAQDSTYAHTIHNQIHHHRTTKSSFILQKFNTSLIYEGSSYFHYKSWAHESHIKQKHKIYCIYMLSRSSITIKTY